MPSEGPHTEGVTLVAMLHKLGQPKVTQLDRMLAEQHIGRLEVAVCDLTLMEMCHCFDQLLGGLRS